jgi:hypothetical protein
MSIRADNLLFNWRRRMLEGGLKAVEADEHVVGTGRVRTPGLGTWAGHCHIDRPHAPPRALAAT